MVFITFMGDTVVCFYVAKVHLETCDIYFNDHTIYEPLPPKKTFEAHLLVGVLWYLCNSILTKCGRHSGRGSMLCS